MSYDFDSMIQTYITYHNKDRVSQLLEGVNDVRTISMCGLFLEDSLDTMDPGDDSTWVNDLFTLDEAKALWDELESRE